jgi:hypothetical protein
LPEFNSLAGHLHKLGDLTQTIFFAKIDGDKETDLASQYQVDGYPSIFIEQ